VHRLVKCHVPLSIRKVISGLTQLFSDWFPSAPNIISSIMFQFNIKAWSMAIMLNHVFYIIVIDYLNKIWNPFQISFHLSQGFLSQYYLRSEGTFFLIHLGWWFIYWSLKYLHIVHVIPNIYHFVTSIKITCNKIKT